LRVEKGKRKQKNIKKPQRAAAAAVAACGTKIKFFLGLLH